jgi:tRNA modification GTPase
MNDRLPDGEQEATGLSTQLSAPRLRQLPIRISISGTMMHFDFDDTIGALSSAAGAAARGIIRVSGPAAVSSVETVFAPADFRRWKSDRFASAHAGSLQLTSIRSQIPVLVYLWPSLRSFTGQPVVEIHAPGSPPLLEAILADLCERGVRPAVAGEFTLRAFLAGKIDLVQAEGVLGVIDAADPEHLRRALRQLAGGISGRIGHLRDGMMDLLADIEAGLDFVDEDIQFVSREETGRRISAAEIELEAILAQCESRMQSTGRARIVLAGLPNAGKSTLFNALVGQDAALVSRVAGTTRDFLRGTIDWSGLSVELVDTAGWDDLLIGESQDPPTSEDGISRAAQSLGQRQWEQADLIVWCSASDLQRSERQVEGAVIESLRRDDRPFLHVCTKSDLEEVGVTESLAISAVRGTGLSELAAECVRMLAGARGGSSDLIGTTVARSRESLSQCRDSLSRARLASASQMGDELVAIEIRHAIDHLGRILGAVYTDDLLDRVFSRFCIGK